MTKVEMDRVFKGVVSPLVKCEPKPEKVKGKLTLRTVAAEYGLSCQLLRAYCGDKRLKAQKLGKSWYVDRADVERVFGLKAKG